MVYTYPIRSFHNIVRVYAMVSCVYFDCTPGERRRQAPSEKDVVSCFLNSLRYALFSLNELGVERYLSRYLGTRSNNVDLLLRKKNEYSVTDHITPFLLVSIS